MSPSTAELTGRVLTVRGPVSPESLGQTLMHEHLFVDLRKAHWPHLKLVEIEGRSEPIYTTEDFPATEIPVWEAKVGLGNLHRAIELEPILDNYVLADEALAVEEVMEFKSRGGGTVVEVTSIGLKRDPLAMRRVSEATGLHVVMGTGFYQKVFHPEDMDYRTVEELTDEIVRDVTEGVGGTDVRAGVIGEIGVNGDPITANETRSIRAAARASVATGGPISFHRGGRLGERHQSLDIVAEEGGDLDRTILGHSDEMAYEIPLMLELLERGVYIQFDLIGRTAPLTPSVLKGQYGNEPGVSITLAVARAIVELIAHGYEDRLLLSHDVCWKVHLKRFGGFGYSYILEKFLPYLRDLGVTEPQIDKMMVRNPATVLPFAAPNG